MTFNLPYPPSVNHYWGSRGNKRFLTHAGRKFRRDAFFIIKTKKPKTTNVEVSVTINVWPPDRRKRDLDNILKPILDVLQYAGVIKDDSQVAELVVRRNPVRLRGASQVQVTALV